MLSPWCFDCSLENSVVAPYAPIQQAAFESAERSFCWEKMMGCSSGCAEAGSSFMVQCCDLASQRIVMNR